MVSFSSTHLQYREYVLWLFPPVPPSAVAQIVHQHLHQGWWRKIYVSAAQVVLKGREYSAVLSIPTCHHARRPARNNPRQCPANILVPTPALHSPFGLCGGVKGVVTQPMPCYCTLSVQACVAVHRLHIITLYALHCTADCHRKLFCATMLPTYTCRSSLCFFSVLPMLVLF
jgi:hypothetical protein